MRHNVVARTSTAVVGGALVVSAAAVAGTGTDAERTGRDDGPGCPNQALQLPANALAPASRAALDSERGRYEALGTRPLVTRAALAEFDQPHGQLARRQCGRRVARRTVVVYLESGSARFRRRRPSLSQGVVLVSRFPSGHRVWRVVR
jgi:hypothetical protein